jgi:hypothetical protein
MNREEIKAAVPALARFDHLQRLLQKEAAENYIGVIIDALSREHRQPDNWEERDLAAALGYVACGWYHAALSAADRALTPPEQRAPAAEQPVEHGAPPTLQDLRHAHFHVSAMAMRN